jgi:hypothetical protein
MAAILPMRDHDPGTSYARKAVFVLQFCCWRRSIRSSPSEPFTSIRDFVTGGRGLFGRVENLEANIRDHIWRDMALSNLTVKAAQPDVKGSRRNCAHSSRYSTRFRR